MTTETDIQATYEKWLGSRADDPTLPHDLIRDAFLAGVEAERQTRGQPAVGEEIHVHIEGLDVLTLPLASSGIGAPRFVVHVPAQPDVSLTPDVQTDRQGRMPSDAEILACLRPLYSNDVAAAMGAEDDLRIARLLLSRFGSGQPTVCQECGGDGAGGLHEDDCSQNSSGHPAASAEPVGEAQPFQPGVTAGAFTHCVFDAKSVPAGTKLYAAPVAAQAQPQQSENQEALADTQRAIIEAAERRGYERAIAECGQDREDVHDIEAAAKTLAECMDYPWEPMSEQGREAMRKHAKRVIDAGHAAKGE